jgi:F-type H+-transporting ATPase subunit b
MIFLEFSVIEPEFGQIFWTSIIFLGLWFFLGRKAFRPIQDALKNREQGIANALNEAQKAREEVVGMKAENEQILSEAREEKNKILKAAAEAKEQIIAEAREAAKVEAGRIMDSARIDIENQKLAAITEVKNQVGLMSIELAEKILRQNLKGNPEQEKFVAEQVQKMNLN